MRKVTFLSFVVLITLLVPIASAKEAPKDVSVRENGLFSGGRGNPQWSLLNINNLWFWLENNGEANHSPNGDNGTYFPRGMVWAIYKDGMKWGGSAYLDAAHTEPAPYGQTIRIGGSDYGNGTLPGRIIGSGATATRQDPGDDDVRVYRIRRDYYTMSEGELNLDAAETYEKSLGSATDAEVQLVYDRYVLDWNEWPVDYGAPYIDRNGDGVYTAPPPFSATFNADSLISQGYDEPGVAGGDPNSPADQVLWNVYNDLDRTRTLAMEGSEPLGLEIQRTVWGYKRSDALGNSYFKRVKIINKGGVDVGGDGTTLGSFYIDSMYVGQWSDPDLGAYSDDLLGCDTTLGVGYVYNGNPSDFEYARHGQVVPAAGYDFLAGPMVPSPGDVAVFDLKYKQDHKNLPMTGFSWFSAGSPISDPPSDYTGGLRWHKMLRGFAPIDGPDQFYPFPEGTPKSSFPYAGDPVTQTGMVDGLGNDWSFPMGDRRMFLVSGPFSLNPGDTTEVTIGFVAGQGADRYSSISVMKFNDRFTQLTYDALFQVTKAPARPDVQVTELDEEIIVEWSSNLSRVSEVENTVSEPGAYAFEGYNVYQMPRGNSTIGDAKRIVTYDLASDPTVILDEGFDATSGQILLKPVQFGSNAGVKRFFVFDRDHVKDVDKLNNGQEYYIAVTAYSAASEAGYIPASLESSPEIITVVPQKPFGTVFNTSYGDVLDVVQAAGQSDGVIIPTVVDPGASTGSTYEITFTDSSGGGVANVFKITNTTDNEVVLSDQKNFTGDSDYPLADGVFVQVSGPALEGKDWDYTGGSGTGVRWISGAGGGELLYGGAYLGPNFTGSNVPPASYVPVEFRLANILEGTVGNGEDYTVDTSHPNASKAATYATWGFGNFTGIIDVPFSAYDVSDPSSPRQLNIVVRDYDGNGAWDMHYEGDDEGENARPYNYTWILDSDYDEAASWDADTEAEDFMGQVDVDGGPVLWALWLKDRGGRPFFSDDGTLTLIPNLVITTSDIYTYASPGPTTGAGEDKISAERVNVFPNPYYAFNPAEVTRMARFVTFNNLPPKATIRIFNLGGQLVTKLSKDDESQFLQWDLLNFQNIPVASGMYLAHVEMVMPSGGEFAKTLKIAIIQEKEMLDIY